MTADTTSDAVRVETPADGIAVVRLDRPKVNALDIPLLDALDAAIGRAAADGRAIVLTGEGSCFSAGIDTRLVGEYGPAERRAMVDGLNRVVHTLYSAPVPTVAAINGHALAGGLILALACDLRLVADGECRLGLPEVQAGVPYPAVPLAVVQAELRPGVARRLGLTGRPLSPREAVEAEVADEVVAAGALVETAIERAAALAGLPVYAKVKSQLKGAVAERTAAIIADESDPMREGWV